MTCRIVRGWSVWVVGLVMIAAALEAHGQFGFAMRAGNDGDKKADWTVEELLEEADEGLDRQWNDKLKANRARAMLYYDEVVRMCKLNDAQKHKLRAAAKGMAHKMTWQWRQQIENQLVSSLEQYHRQGVSRAQARNLVANYTQGHVYFGSSNERNTPQVFWNRSVASVLDAESRKKLKERQKRREERLWKLQKEWMLATLDQGLRLTDEQEAKLRKILDSQGGRVGMMRMEMMVAGDDDDPFEMSTMPQSWMIMQMFQSNPEARKILSKEQWEVIKASMRNNGWEEAIPEEAEEEEAEDNADEAERDDRPAETDEKSSEKDEGDASETNADGSKEKSGGEGAQEESGPGSSGGRSQ